MVSLAPALLMLVALLGLAGTPATQPLLDNLAEIAPGPVRQNLSDATALLALAVVLSGPLARESAS